MLNEIFGPGKTHKQKFTNALQRMNFIEMQEISCHDCMCRLFGKFYRRALQYGPSYFLYL
jgi:hypothetical protein